MVTEGKAQTADIGVGQVINKDYRVGHAGIDEVGRILLAANPYKLFQGKTAGRGEMNGDLGVFNACFDNTS